MKQTVLSICDRTGNMVRPWAEAGYPCLIVDEQHPAGSSEFAENVTAIGVDIHHWIPPKREYAFVSAFPPCTNLAVSGARWFREKGMAGLIQGLQIVERCRLICEWCEAPWMLENPVSVLASYWRKPDYTFHPWHYAGWFTLNDERYYKRTCLWVGGGFRMPTPLPIEPDDSPESERIWRMAPSAERANLRSETPLGFAHAVFQEMNPHGLDLPIPLCQQRCSVRSAVVGGDRSPLWGDAMDGEEDSRQGVGEVGDRSDADTRDPGLDIGELQ